MVSHSILGESNEDSLYLFCVMRMLTVVCILQKVIVGLNLSESVFKMNFQSYKLCQEYQTLEDARYSILGDHEENSSYLACLVGIQSGVSTVQEVIVNQKS